MDVSEAKRVKALEDENAKYDEDESLGGNRAHDIGYHIEGSGVVWPILEDGMDIISAYTEEMNDPDADLSKIAEEMADRFMVALKENADDTPMVELLEEFGSDIRALVLTTLPHQYAGLAP